MAAHSTESSTLNKADKKKPPLPPRPNAVENVTYINQGYNFFNSTSGRPNSTSNYNFSNVNMPTHYMPQPQSFGPAPNSPGSPGTSRLMGPRYMPTPSHQSQNSFGSGGFAPGIPGFTSNTYQNTANPSSVGFMPMPMPMPTTYMNLSYSTPNTNQPLSSQSSIYSTCSSIGSDISFSSVPTFPSPSKNSNEVTHTPKLNSPPPLPQKNNSLRQNLSSSNLPQKNTESELNTHILLEGDLFQQDKISSTIIVKDSDSDLNYQLQPSQLTDSLQKKYISSNTLQSSENLELNPQLLPTQKEDSFHQNINSSSSLQKNPGLDSNTQVELPPDEKPLHIFIDKHKTTPDIEICEKDNKILAGIKLSEYVSSSDMPKMSSPISLDVEKTDNLVSGSNSLSSGSGDTSPSSRPMFNKRTFSRGKGTGYSFSQHVNHNPPSYNPDGTISASAPVSTNIDASSRKSSISLPKKSSSVKYLFPIDDPEEKSETLLLDSIDSSKLSEQGLLILSFTKRELRYIWKMKKIKNFIIHNIRISSIFPDESKEEAIEAILGDLPSLLTSYHQFIDDLTERLKEEAKGGRSEGYSKIFLRRIEGFAKFVSFAQNLPQIRTYIVTAKNNSPKFKLWLQDIEENGLFGSKSLIETLEAVNVQLNSYPVLLEEIKYASSDTSGADRMVLDAVVYTFEDLVADLATLRFPSPSENSVNDMTEIEENLVIQPDAVNWSSAVSESILKSTDKKECKRQEAIFEFVKSEREYVNDLNTIHNLFVSGIKKSSFIVPQQHDIIIHKLFFNYSDFMDLHLSISANLDKRQKESAVVDRIGDLLLSWSQNLDPYKIYGARVQFATEYCTKERINNSKFAQFLRECEHNKATRKLSIDSFISLPTRRLARYPLYFKEIRKHTPDDHPDAAILDNILENISRHLSLIDQTKGETDTKLRLRAISDRLELLPQHKDDSSTILELEHPERRLIKEGYLKFIKGSVLVRVFLFDHCLLFAKEYELAEDLFEYQSFKKPVPLKHLTISGTVSSQTIQAHSSTGFFDSVFSSSSASSPSPELCFSIANSQTNQLFLLAATIQSEKDLWVSAITDEISQFM